MGLHPSIDMICRGDQTAILFSIGDQPITLYLHNLTKELTVNLPPRTAFHYHRPYFDRDPEQYLDSLAQGIGSLISHTEQSLDRTLSWSHSNPSPGIPLFRKSRPRLRTPQNDRLKKEMDGARILRHLAEYGLGFTESFPTPQNDPYRTIHYQLKFVRSQSTLLRTYTQLLASSTRNSYLRSLTLFQQAYYRTKEKLDDLFLEVRDRNTSIK